MTIANHYSPFSSINSLTGRRSVRSPRLWGPIYLPVLLLKRLWWHGKAYSVAFTVLLLLFLSLGLLSLEKAIRKQVRSFTS